MLRSLNEQAIGGAVKHLLNSRGTKIATTAAMKLKTEDLATRQGIGQKLFGADTQCYAIHDVVAILQLGLDNKYFIRIGKISSIARRANGKGKKQTFLILPVDVKDINSNHTFEALWFECKPGSEVCYRLPKETPDATYFQLDLIVARIESLMYSAILPDEEEATEETEIYNWTLGDQDCVVLKQMVQTKNNSIEADVQDFDFNRDAAIDVEQLPPHQDESHAVDNDEEISFKSAMTAAANLDHPLVPMMTAERVHRISLKTYCMVVIDGIWTLVYLYGAVNGVDTSYKYCIDGVFQVGKCIHLLPAHYGRYQTMSVTVEGSPDELLLCPDRWLYLKRSS